MTTLPGPVIPLPTPASLPGGILSTTTSSGATPSSSSTTGTSLSFNAIAGILACTEEIISWEAFGPLTNLTLTVTNHSVAIPSPGVARRQYDGSSFFSQTIVTGLDPGQRYYPWNPVDVSQGEYVIVGTADGLTIPAKSQSFYVAEGSDTSCLVSSSTSSAASTPPTAASTPVLASSKKHTAGAIAGGVIGGIAFVIALIAAFLLYRRYNRAGRTRRAAANFVSQGKWNGLSSLDSNIHNTLPPPGGKSGGYDTKDFVGGNYIADNSSDGHGKGSDEDATTLAESEKLDDKRTSDYMDAIAPLPYHNRRRSSLTIASNASYPTTPSPTHPHPRTKSSSGQNFGFSPSPPTSPARSGSFGRRARQSLDGRVLSNSIDFSSVTTPTSPVSAEMIPMNRSASGGNRRHPTSRKPVPTYAAADFGGVESDHASPSRSNSVASRNNEVYSNTQANESTSGSSSNLHHQRALSPVLSREELRIGGLEIPKIPELNHKSSFGDGRPLHYLIPDMPPPAQD